MHVAPATFGSGGIYGGGERYVVELARAMAGSVTTRLVTFSDVASRDVVDGVDTVALKSRGLWRGADVNPLSERLAHALWDADVVHVHQWDSIVANACVILQAARRRPVFATDHGGSGRNYWRRLRLNRLLTGFLAVSSFATGFYPELGNRTRVIYGGADTEKFAPATNMSRNGVAAVGRLLPHKGLDVLLRGISADTQLTIVGRSYDAAYRSLLTELAEGKAVSFVEDATDQTIRGIYRSSRLSVLASTHHPIMGPPAPKPELLGLALLEAMASGTPVIATDVGGMPEVVDDGVTGLVVPPGDSRALGKAIEELDHDDLRWTAMSRAARARVLREFTWSATADRCLTAYQDLAR